MNDRAIFKRQLAFDYSNEFNATFGHLNSTQKNLFANIVLFESPIR